MQAENNSVELIGYVDSDLEFSHEVYGENFYLFNVMVKRLSDVYDVIPVMASDRIVNRHCARFGDCLHIVGQYRSYNNYTDVGNRLVLTVFAKNITSVSGAHEDINTINLNGYICKPPIYRTTPFGREIADLLVAVNRTYNKSDYIPCIAWGRNARYSSGLLVGSNVAICGRIQSRNYQKQLESGEVLTKTAYEVSINTIV